MSYNPSGNAELGGIQSTRLLSQRDLSLQIPVNFVNVPGVSLTAACFPNRTYEDGAAIRCFSNLLIVGFRCIEVDLYWDSSQRSWTLCPAELGALPPNARNSLTTDVTVASSQTGSISSVSLTGRGLEDVVGIWRRQTEGTLDISQSHSLNAPTTAPLSLPSNATIGANVSTSAVRPAGAPSSTVPAPAPVSGSMLFQIGPYRCTSTINFSLLTNVLLGQLDNTDFSINATTKYLMLNLHAAAPANNSTGSSQRPATSNLPEGNDQLSYIIQTNLSNFIYGPSDLADQRANLNNSWYSVVVSSQPDPSYYTTTYSNGHASTPDGWPSENYVELQNERRLFVGFGKIDPQMEQYNRTADASTIFDPEYIVDHRFITTTDTGQVNSGCFLNPGQTPISDVNSSWAVPQRVNSPSSDASPLDLMLDIASNLTACGISPILNQTLVGASADISYTPYSEYVQSTIWSWAVGEPRNTTNEGNAGASPNCAAMNSTNNGRWQVSDCTTQHYAACRVGTEPYQWELSNMRGSYTNVDVSCPYNTTFAVPRTALENAYLIAAFNAARQGIGTDTELLWLNFNQLDVPSCWVIGQNTVCPYQLADANARRYVIVPIVAAVIVFVLAALTVFVKCAANRRSSKRRRRRGDDGWDYEGVPS